MKIGLLADIHEDLDALRECIELLRREHVDRWVVLGDLFYGGRRIPEIVETLAGIGAIGVWGNHDMGLAYDPTPAMQARYPARAFEYVETLGARLELGECLFTHALPQNDPFDCAAYYLGDRPETEEGRAAAFAASDRRLTFTGHYHRWLAAAPGELLSWNGATPLPIPSPSRYLLVIAAVCDGWCAVYDAEECVLTPQRIAGRMPPVGLEPTT